MTGPQTPGRGYNPPAPSAERLRRSGVRIYPVLVGRNVNLPEVMSISPNADDLTYVPEYNQLKPAAATLAPAVREGRVEHLYIIMRVPIWTFTKQVPGMNCW